MGGIGANKFLFAFCSDIAFVREGEVNNMQLLHELIDASPLLLIDDEEILPNPILGTVTNSELRESILSIPGLTEVILDKLNILYKLKTSPRFGSNTKFRETLEALSLVICNKIDEDNTQPQLIEATRLGLIWLMNSNLSYNV